MARRAKDTTASARRRSGPGSLTTSPVSSDPLPASDSEITSLTGRGATGAGADGGPRQRADRAVVDRAQQQADALGTARHPLAGAQQERHAPPSVGVHRRAAPSPPWRRPGTGG